MRVRSTELIKATTYESPRAAGFLDQSLRGFLDLHLVVVRFDDLVHVFVRQVIPHPVTGYNYELLISASADALDLRFRDHPHLRSHLVAHASGHCKPRSIQVRQPNPFRSYRVQLRIPLTLHSPARVQDSLPLHYVLWLMVCCQRDDVILRI